jgi:dCTP deaminase
MPILSKTAIKQLLQSGDLVIEPLPKEEHYDSDAVEVHLSDKVYVWEKPQGGATLTVPLWTALDPFPVEPFHYKRFADKHLKQVPLDPDGILTMRPHTFYLADVKQWTKLPPDVAMHIQGKSTLARLGVLIHLTAPHAHAGWEGHLTLEIYNLGPFNLELKPGVAIGQLTIWRVEKPLLREETPQGQFAKQQDAAGRTSTG